MIKYAIIENEPFAQDNLRDTINKIRTNYVEVFCAEDIASTVEWLKTKPEVDIIFLDVELNDGNCFEIFTQVETELPIVFTTAYDEYALKAFESNSIDYLLKPILKDALANALDKFERLRRPISPELMKILSTGRQRYRERILISKGDKYCLIDVDHVNHFISEDKYVVAYTDDNRSYITNFPNLAELKETLDPSHFFQVSRSTILNVKAISSINKYFGNRIKVVSGNGPSSKEIIVSLYRKNDFLAWLEGDNLM